MDKKWIRKKKQTSKFVITTATLQISRVMCNQNQKDYVIYIKYLF